jgi:hypothetical protein
MNVPSMLPDIEHELTTVTFSKTWVGVWKYGELMYTLPGPGSNTLSLHLLPSCCETMSGQLRPATT